MGVHNTIFMRVHRSKTIQLGERKLDLPLPFIPGHLLCPVTALVSMLKSVQGLLPSQPLFMIMTQSGPKPLLYSQFIHDLRSVLARIGYNPKLYTGHSFRRGGATWALQVGVPGEAIQLLGDWKSSSYKRYIDISFEKRVQYINVLSNNLPT